MRHDDGRKSPESVKALAIQSLDADKALDIETIDLVGQSALADFLVIATGTSSRHVSALAEKLTERLSALGLKDVYTEGLKGGDWVVIDAGDVIIHIFKPEVRSFYNIEKMWQVPRRAADMVTA